MPLKAYVITGEAPELSLTEIEADTISSKRLPGRYASLEEACQARDRLVRLNDADHHGQHMREAGISRSIAFVSLS